MLLNKRIIGWPYCHIARTAFTFFWIVRAIKGLAICKVTTDLCQEIKKLFVTLNLSHYDNSSFVSCLLRLFAIVPVTKRTVLKLAY